MEQYLFIKKKNYNWKLSQIEYNPLVGIEPDKSSFKEIYPKAIIDQLPEINDNSYERGISKPIQNLNSNFQILNSRI